MKERKIVTALLGCFMLMIGCTINCQAEEKSSNLIVQSFFHYEMFDDDEFTFLFFKPANEINKLLESHGFSLINSGSEYNEDYFEDLAFITYKAGDIEVKIYISPEGQDFVEYIEMKFDSSVVRQKFLDDSERNGLIKDDNGYFLDGYCESGIVVILLDNNMLSISDFSI